MAITKSDLLAAENPIPGDPDMIAAVANDYANMADTIAQTVATLDDLSGRNATLNGTSITALQEQITEIRSMLSKVQTCYETISGALDTYHPILRACKDAVEPIQIAVRSCDQSLNQARIEYQSIVEELLFHSQGDRSREEYLEYFAERQETKQHLMTSCSDLEAEIGGYIEEAGTHYDTSLQAAKTAADAINSSLDGSLVDAWNESEQKVLQSASWVGGWVSFALGGVSLALIPFTGGGSYGVAMASFGVAAATLGVDVILLTQYDEGTWEGVLIDAAFLTMPGVAKLAGRLPVFRVFKGSNTVFTEDVAAARKSILARGPVTKAPDMGFASDSVQTLLENIWRSVGQGATPVVRLNNLVQRTPLTAADVALINKALESQGVALRWNVSKKVYECVVEPGLNEKAKDLAGVS